MPSTPAQARTWKIYTAAFAVLCLGLGFAAGFFTAKHMGTDYLSACYRSRADDDAAVDGALQPLPHTRGMPVTGYALRELPPPWSQEGRSKEQQDDSAHRADLFTYFSDTETITEGLTVAFLGHLQTSLGASGVNSSANIDLQEVIQEFKSVARDVLSYLRYHNSQALLLLLRQYSQTRSFTMADVDPDVLQQEVQRLLDLRELGNWYARVSRRDTDGHVTRPTIGIQATEGTSEMLLDADSSRSASGNHHHHHRHLLAAAQHHRHPYTRPLRRLQAEVVAAAAATAAAADAASGAAATPAPADAESGAPIPAIPIQEAIASKVPATVSPLMTLKDMLCHVKEYSPTGLTGMLMPSNGTAKGTVISCPPLPEPTIFRHNTVVFKPVKIPVVFHCQRFRDASGTLMPPMWRAEQAAENLIKVANQKWERALVQFVLQEVRYDVQKYPYLLLGSLKDWQECTGNPSQEAAGFPCLADTAKFPAVAALTAKHVLSVIVGGSQTPTFCNGTKEDICNSLYMGYTGSIGPWYTQVSPTWSEESLTENWVFITWDEFAPMWRNSKRFWDGGGVTFAHEVGHYLGLMHTHAGTTPCEGDGLTKADAIPDTPVNLQTAQWAAQNGLAVQLARWCSYFRTGKKPDPKELLPFNSCKVAVLAIDNVFNLLSYSPDACSMLVSPNQIARMQWAIAKFRPKMMAAYAV